MGYCHTKISDARTFFDKEIRNVFYMKISKSRYEIHVVAVRLLALLEMSIKSYFQPENGLPDPKWSLSCSLPSQAIIIIIIIKTLQQYNKGKKTWVQQNKRTDEGQHQQCGAASTKQTQKETYKPKLGGTGGTRTDDMKRASPVRDKILFKVFPKEVQNMTTSGRKR